MTRLPGFEIERLVKALLEAFNRHDLKQLLLFKLDKHLDEIVPANSNLREAMLEVIQAAERGGWLDDFLAAVREARPNFDAQLLTSRPISHLVAPPPPDTFAGRTKPLHQIGGWLKAGEDVAVTAAIQGGGGIGKTTLAQKLGRDLATDFPGGVLWIEAGPSATQQDLIARAADRLGANVTVAGPDARAALVRRAAEARGRMLVVMDDLWDADLGRWAVKALLPADRALLVTSRDAALCRALCGHVERLDVLPDDEALAMLGNFFEGGLGEYGADAREVVKQVEGLPLALVLAAGQCVNGPADLARVARELARRPSLGVLKLEGQEMRDTSVEASLALTLARLDEEGRQRFRALGAFGPGAFDLRALAVVWDDAEPDSAEQWARALSRWGLMRAEAAPGTYTQHMLLRAYARVLAEQAGEADTALIRCAGYHLEEGRAAEARYMEGNEGVLDGLRRFDAAWPHLRAVWERLQDRGDEVALRWRNDMPEVVAELLSLRTTPRERIRLLQAAAQAAHTLINQKGEATHLGNLGLAHWVLGEQRAAIEHYSQALRMDREIGNRRGEGIHLDHLGSAYRHLGKLDKAIECHQSALSIAQETGDRRGERSVLSNLGNDHVQLGEPREAIEYYKQALAIAQQIGDRWGEGLELGHLGIGYRALGELQTATEYIERALDIAWQIGDRRGEGLRLGALGLVYTKQGDARRAISYSEQALVIRREIGDRRGEGIDLGNLGRAYANLDDGHIAITHYERALNLFREIGERWLEGQHLGDLGRAYAMLGEPDIAIRYITEGLELLKAVGDSGLVTEAQWKLGTVYEMQGDYAYAAALMQVRVEYEREIGHADAAKHAARLAEVMRKAGEGSGGI